MPEQFLHLPVSERRMLETGMIYGEPLPFDVIITGIREIEREVNA